MKKKEIEKLLIRLINEVTDEIVTLEDNIKKTYNSKEKNKIEGSISAYYNILETLDIEYRNYKL